MVKLNQVNALVTGRKSEIEKFVGDLYKVVQKGELFDGLQRTYKPLDEENGEKLPPEARKVQTTAKSLITEAREKWSELWNLTAQQDEGNTSARADVIVDGVVVLRGVPVTTLLFLQKQLNDLETFLSKMPLPDPSEEWSYDPNSGLLKTQAQQTARTKKVTDFKVVVPPTDKHPAQVVQVTEDVLAGYWNRILYSGRLPAVERIMMVQKVKKLQDAVKVAREQANMTEVGRVDVATPIFDFVLGSTQV